MKEHLNTIKKLVSQVPSSGADRRLSINFLPFNFVLNFTGKKGINLGRNTHKGIWHYFSTIACLKYPEKINFSIFFWENKDMNVLSFEILPQICNLVVTSDSSDKHSCE